MIEINNNYKDRNLLKFTAQFKGFLMVLLSKFENFFPPDFKGEHIVVP